MKNFFKFKIGDEEFTKCNHVGKAFEHWLNGKAFAAYMSVFYNEKRVDKKVELIDFNDNIARGELFATYRISISDTEMPYGITKVGFAPQPGAKLSNECEVTMPAASAVIYGTVYLEPSGNMALYPGENSLVRSLLGMNKCGAMELKGSRDVLDNCVAQVSPDSYKSISFKTVLADGCIEFEFASGSYSDFMLFTDSQPCARFNALFAFPQVKERDVSSHCGASLNSTVRVENAVYSGSPVDYGYFYNINKIYPSGTEGIKGFGGYKLFCDPLHRHVGLKTDSLYCILDVETQSVIRKGSYKGELTLCADGSLVSVSNGVINFIDKNKSESIIQGSTVVFSREGGYDIFVLANNVLFDNTLKDLLYIYRYESSLSLIRTYQHSATDNKLGGINNHVVAVYNKNVKNPYISTGAASYAFGLDLMGDEPIYQGIFYGDGYVGSAYRYSNHICDKAFNNFYVKGKELYFMGTLETVSLGKKENVEDAVLVGDTVILREDGMLNFYKAGIIGICVSMPVSGTVNCTEHVLASSQFDKLKLTIKSKGDL